MAVEARHMNLLPQQIITNRELMTFDQANAYGYNSDQMSYVVPFGTTMADANNTFFPLNQSLVCDSFQAKTSMKAESGLTCNLPNNIIAPRKRTRDAMNNQLNSVLVPQKHNYPQDFSSSVVGEDSFSLKIQQQLELDHIISQHTKKIRLEVEERQKQQARLLVSALGGSVMKTLKEKDEQIQKMVRLNFALQERAKSLYLESQLWKDLAQSHEATAMSLHCNLEQMLQAHVSDEQRVSAVAEEAESCCGDEEEVEVAGQRRTLAGGSHGNRMCRKCGERESCVLLLPCRHLCLCTMCGTTLQSTCPVCNSSMNATVHVSMS